MTTLRKAAQQALEALESSRRSHHYCEDTWYSCPQHEGGCANEAEGDECNCGADKANEKIDQAITAIKQALAEPEQEPVAWANMRLDGRTPTMLSISQHPEDRANWVNPVPLYTHPAPQPVTLTDEEIELLAVKHAPPIDPAFAQHDDFIEFARAIERAHEAKQGEQT